MTRIYYHDTPKPLALYRERIQRGYSEADAKKDFYGEFYRRWGYMRFQDLQRFYRHLNKVVRIAQHEVEKHERRAA